MKIFGEDGDWCDDEAHYFDTDDDNTVPLERACICGEVTWRQMNELLMLTNMLRITIE